MRRLRSRQHQRPLGCTTRKLGFEVTAAEAHRTKCASAVVKAERVDALAAPARVGANCTPACLRPAPTRVPEPAAAASTEDSATAHMIRTSRRDISRSPSRRRGIRRARATRNGWAIAAGDRRRAKRLTQRFTAIHLCSHVGQAFRPACARPICRAEALPHMSNAVTTQASTGEHWV